VSSFELITRRSAEAERLAQRRQFLVLPGR